MNNNPTNRTLVAVGLLSALAFIAQPAAAGGGGQGNCNPGPNYGIEVNNYNFADCHGDNYGQYQYCDQHSGVGAGAASGAIGVGPNTDPKSAAGAEATAGTHCSQSNNGTKGADLFMLPAGPGLGSGLGWPAITNGIDLSANTPSLKLYA